MPKRDRVIAMPPMPAGGTAESGQPQLQRPLASQVALLWAPQLVDAIDSAPDRPTLLQVLLASQELIIKALNKGMTHQNLYDLMCRDFIPRLEYSYSHFSGTLTAFEDLVGFRSVRKNIGFTDPTPAATGTGNRAPDPVLPVKLAGTSKERAEARVAPSRVSPPAPAAAVAPLSPRGTEPRYSAKVTLVLDEFKRVLAAAEDDLLKSAGCSAEIRQQKRMRIRELKADRDLFCEQLAKGLFSLPDWMTDPLASDK